MGAASMARKSSKVAQVKIRVREDLRRRIEQEAKKRGVSANLEMVNRLQWSFDQENLRTLADVSEDQKIIWGRISGAIHGLNRQGDLIRSVAALLEQVDQLSANTGTKALESAAIRVRHVIASIEAEAAKLPSHMRTTGADK
jgi:hypothetical protein